MILASRMKEWFLAAFAPHIRGCNLSTNHQPIHDAERFHIWNGSIYVWSHAPTDGVIFYPQCRYKGMKVFIRGWKNGTAQPVLKCESGASASDYPPGAGQEFSEMLRQEGWRDMGRLEPMIGFVHVDDLEKIEGPPPDGTF